MKIHTHHSWPLSEANILAPPEIVDCSGPPNLRTGGSTLKHTKCGVLKWSFIINNLTFLLAKGDITNRRLNLEKLRPEVLREVDDRLIANMNVRDCLLKNAHFVPANFFPKEFYNGKLLILFWGTIRQALHEKLVPGVMWKNGSLIEHNCVIEEWADGIDGDKTYTDAIALFT